ncbi:MAG: phosphatase PAP2 family protein [Anaerolineae bacterium]|nr:phosphatase PAP2 family protein [Anaerolineae bacterium]
MLTRILSTDSRRCAGIVLGMVLAGCATMLLFAALSAPILDLAAVQDFDAERAAWFFAHADPTVQDVFRVITVFGSEVLWVVGFGLGATFIARRDWTLLAGWALAMAVGKLWNMGLKEWIAAPRPAFDGWTNPEGGYGYPSGHTMQATIAYGMLAYLAWRRVISRRARAALIVAAAAIIVLIGLSRLVLVVHFPSQVIGALLAGGLWLLASAGFTAHLRGCDGVCSGQRQHEGQEEARETI